MNPQQSLGFWVLLALQLHNSRIPIWDWRTAQSHEITAGKYLLKTTGIYLKSRESHSPRETDEGVDGEEESLLFVGLAEENQDPDVHGSQGQPVGTAQILNWKKQNLSKGVMQEFLLLHNPLSHPEPTLDTQTRPVLSTTAKKPR